MKQVLIFGTILFLLLSSLSLGSFAMVASPHGQMSDCPFMGDAVLCQMTPLEHIATWQSMLTAIPMESTLILMGMFLFEFLAAHTFTAIPKELAPQTAIRRRWRLTDLISPTLQQAFSDGILNPKVF